MCIYKRCFAHHKQEPDTGAFFFKRDCSQQTRIFHFLSLAILCTSGLTPARFPSTLRKKIWKRDPLRTCASVNFYTVRTTSKIFKGPSDCIGFYGNLVTWSFFKLGSVGGGFHGMSGIVWTAQNIASWWLGPLFWWNGDSRQGRPKGTLINPLVWMST